MTSAAELEATAPSDSQPVLPTAGPSRGSQIGRFVVLDILGTGGMGIVYAAYDPHLDRKVAIKLLRVQAAGSDEAHMRLLREAQAMARIDHPNVLRVHEAGAYEDQIYIAMEFATGGTLRRWLADAHRDPGDIVAKLVDAGRGLAAAHAAGLVHRDFKPDNILLVAGGRACVTDFGLVGTIGAKPATRVARPDEPLSNTTPLSQQLTRTGAMMGTPAYMSPEQFVGLDVGPAADQFAFCVTLYEALYGRRPFAGDTFAELCANVLSGELRPPPRASRAARVVQRGLALAPSKRYASMDALLRELSHTPHTRRWLAGAAAAIAIAGGVVAFVATRETPPPPCGGADGRLATAWGPADDARLAQALGAPALARVTPIVDGWRTRWREAYVGACEDTQVRAIQSEHLLDLRMDCLSRRLDDAHASLDTLAGGGSDAVVHAVDVARDLPDLAPCSDARALTAAIPPPDSEATRRAVAGVRTVIAQVETQITLGRSPVALARRALVDARATGYRPVIAEALYDAGRTQVHVDRAAGDTLAEAMQTAIETGNSALAVRAASDRIALLAKSATSFPVADEIARVATALAARAPTRADFELDHAVAMLLAAEGHGDEARARAKDALARATKELGPDDSVVLVLLDQLGILEAERHHFADARKLFEQLAAADERVYGINHPNYATALDNLANVDHDQGKPADAKAKRERGLAIRLAAFGPDDARVAEAYVALAAVVEEAGDLATAKTYFEKALAIQRMIYGEDNVQIVTALVDLGLTLSDLGDHDAGRAMLEQGLALLEKAYGSDDPRIVSVLHGLGVIVREQHHDADALALFERAERISAKAYGPDDMRTADDIGEIATTYRSMGKLAEARTASARAIAVMEKVYGADSPRMAAALGNYAVLQLDLKDAAGALASGQRARHIFETTLGKDHPAVAMTTIIVGAALIDLHREPEAVTALEQGLAIAGDKLSPKDLAELHFTLASALDRRDRVRARHEAAAAIAAYERVHDQAGADKVKAWLRTH